MVDPWDVWDKAMKRSAAPEREAAEMTDAQLVALLASDRERRRVERRIIANELYARLTSGRVRRAEESDTDTTLVEDALNMEPTIQPAPPDFRDWS